MARLGGLSCSSLAGWIGGGSDTSAWRLGGKGGRLIYLPGRGLWKIVA